MKTLGLLLSLLLGMWTMRAASPLFQYDQARVDSLFAGLTAAPQQAQSLSGMDHSSAWVESSANLLLPGEETSGEPKKSLGGLSGFLWGFIASLPGVIYVYLRTKDENERTQVIYGCISSAYIIGCCFLFFDPYWYM